MPKRKAPPHNPGDIDPEGIRIRCFLLITLDAALLSETAARLRKGDYGVPYEFVFFTILGEILDLLVQDSTEFQQRPPVIQKGILALAALPKGRARPEAPADVIDMIMELLDAKTQTLHHAQQRLSSCTELAMGWQCHKLLELVLSWK